MIKEIKTKIFEGVAVISPEGATGYKTYKDFDSTMIEFDIKYGSGKKWFYIKRDNLYTAMGVSTDLTEEQCSLICEPMVEIDLVENSDMPNVREISSIEVFNNLMQSLECYSVNPYGEEPKDIPDLGAFTQSIRKKHQQWKKAEETTGTWIILKKEAGR